MEAKKEAELLLIEAKENAENLVYSFFNLNMTWNIAKQSALICVEELIKEQTMWQNGEVNPVLYWQEVKNEIKKL
jgi:hypothetical protein